MFATPLRQSLAGRLLRYLIELLRDFLDLFHGSRDMSVLVIAAVVVVAAVVVARIVVTRRLDERRSASGSQRGARITRTDPWMAANAHAAAGDYAAACHALYEAVIESLARGGRITLHASKTSGDYARELRRRGSSSAGEFSAFARRFDRVIYGSATTSADDFAALSRLASGAAGMAAAA